MRTNSFKEKNSISHKPDSVTLPHTAGERPSFIWPLHYCRDLALHFCRDVAPHCCGTLLPTLQPTPKGSGGPPSKTGICGITAHKVYPSLILLYGTVSSYLTFSSLPSVALAKEGRYFLWHFLLSRFSTGQPAVNRCVALCCPDFPSLIKRDDGRLIEERNYGFIMIYVAVWNMH